MSTTAFRAVFMDFTIKKYNQNCLILSRIKFNAIKESELNNLRHSGESRSPEQTEINGFRFLPE